MQIKLKLTRANNLAHYGVPYGTVVTLDLDGDYLPICIASEIYESNTRTPPEAKKAQAVASRNYIVAQTQKGQTIDDTANYQAFSWKDSSTIPNCIAAVQATAGQVLMHGGKPITAWYSNSNGGQTKSSKRAWGSETAWTTDQPDPWDTAGRIKWGQTPASHSVGMSQIGAAYAAYAGISYADILAFYYPMTTIANNFGTSTIKESDDDMANFEKSNTGLVLFAGQLLGQAYWYGTCCYKCTTSLLNAKSKQYPSHYTSARMPGYNQNIKDGKTCADCIGLLKGYLWEKDGKVVYNAATDYNTTGLFNRSAVIGLINTIPEVPGVIVYHTGHVGVFVGDGDVIEAKGFKYGIVRSKLSEGKWTHWLACPDLSYAGYEAKLGKNDFTDPYTAVVSTKSTSLNIWTDSAKTKSLKKVKKGDSLTVTGFASPIGWLKVEKDGTAGVADGRYLLRVGTKDVEDDFDDADEIGDNKSATAPDVTGDEAPPILYQAEVAGTRIGLNLRVSPALSNNTILLLSNGAVVDVLRDDIEGGFFYVRYGEEIGYTTGSYLKRVTQKDG